jgi:hypothetical protein
MSFIKDIKAIFAWLGSSKGQAVIGTAEGVAVTIGTLTGNGAAVQAGVNLANKWLTEIIKTETIALGAGQAEGTGAQKAAIAIDAMLPQLLDFLKGEGLTTDQTNARATAINNAGAAFVNAIFGTTKPTA